MDYHLRVCIGCLTRVLVMLGTENFLKEKDKKEKEKQSRGHGYCTVSVNLVNHVESFKY